MKNITLEKSIVFLFFLSFFLLGLNIFKDYGISIDEDNLRMVGFLSLETVSNFFSFENFSIKLEEIIKDNSSAHPRDEVSTSGIIFDLPMSLIEYLFDLKDSRSHFLLRHFFTFFIFYISVYFFYIIIKKKYNSYFLALIGCLFLIISPRIFANSFYNSKDIIFMSLLIISIHYTFRFIRNQNLMSVVLLSLIFSLMINLRILGIIFPILSSLFFIIYQLRQKRIEINSYLNFILFYFLIILFSIIISPELWKNTLTNVLDIVLFLKEHFLKIYVLYLGKFYYLSEVPWHYHMVWIGISTPLLYLFFFAIGFLNLIIRFFKRLINIDKNDSLKDLWRGNKELEDLYFLFAWIISIFIIIDVGMLRYNDWRHLYFTYPLFILISLNGIYRSINLIKFKYSNIARIIIVLLLLPNINWMIQNHPHQNIYFNLLGKKNFNQNFEMDYWGLSNKQALEFLLKINQKDLSVMTLSTADLNLSKKIFKKNDRDRINVVYKLGQADYLIDTHYSWKGESINANILNEYDLLYEIKIDEMPVNSIYKKKGLE